MDALYWKFHYYGLTEAGTYDEMVLNPEAIAPELKKLFLEYHNAHLENSKILSVTFEKPADHLLSCNNIPKSKK